MPNLRDLEGSGASALLQLLFLLPVPAGQEGPHPCPRTAAVPRFVGAGADTHQVSAGYVQGLADPVVVFKIKPAELGWVGLW